MAATLDDSKARRSGLEALSAAFGDRLSRNRAICEQHGRGEAHHPTEAPDAVLMAHSTADVARAVSICAAHALPVVPFGTGTSLEGHVAAMRGGLSIDMTAMDRVLEVNEADLDVMVEAGITRKALNEHLRDKGVFFPIDPGANASLGGMAATNASGTNAVRYGTMRETVLGLTLVTASGAIMRTGTRARKSSAGYDLTRLFVGSEGTLGVITELRLKVFGIPEAIGAAVCSFPTVEAAVGSVIETIQMGLPVARIEFLDALQMQGCIAYSKLEGMQAAPTLFYEFHGSPAGVAEQAQTVQAIAAAAGGSDFAWAHEAETRTRLWQARHDAYYAALALRPGARAWVTDVCVPISELPGAIERARRAILDAGLIAPIVGHVGDGNFHVIFLLDAAKPAEWEKAKRINKDMVAHAIAVGGTCTGEHGVGYGKIDSLENEAGPAGIAAMRAIKQALDPQGLMNPGKLFR